MLLLFTDTHWDDQDINEYRWKIFDDVRRISRENNITHIYHLGDAVDRKDRFSGAFVNRLIGEMRSLTEAAPVTVLKGNHDSPLNGPAFFDFLNYVGTRLRYITEPETQGALALLPYSPKPIEDWAHIDFLKLKGAFMHQTPSGARSENGQSLTGHKLPDFPKKLHVYTGDAHVQQKIKNVTCVGCPYQIKFGDDFPCRILLLDPQTFAVAKEFKLESQRKRVLTVSSLEEMRRLKIAKGDQIRVKFNLPSDQASNWGTIEGQVIDWAKDAGVSVDSVQATIQQHEAAAADSSVDPRAALAQFVADEKLGDVMGAAGLEFLNEAIGGGKT